MLKPAAMQRIAVVGSREERQRIVSILYDLGVVQIEPLSKTAVPFLRTELDSANLREVSEEFLRVRSLRAALPQTGRVEKRGFASPRELIDVSRSIGIDDEVSKLKQDQSRLTLEIDDLKNKVDLVNKLQFIDEDLSIFDLESAASFFGTFSAEAHEELRKTLSSLENVILYSSGKEPVSLVVVVPNQALERFGSIIQKADLRLQRIPKFKGKPAQVLSKLQDDVRKDEAELNQIDEKLRTLSEKYYNILSSVEEQLSIESRKLEVINNFGFTDSTFALEGWVPVRRLGELEEVLNRLTRSTNMFKIQGEDKPPTLLENPKRFGFFESFIRFYSLPQQWEFDPTMIFGITFPIFFGLMLGDVGYGLVILGISYWILNRVKNPGGKTLVPRMLRSFASNIFKPQQFQKLAMAMIPGAIIGAILGFFFNEYFGFHFNQYLYSFIQNSLHIGLPTYLTQTGAFLDPISSGGLKTLLLLSGYIGVFEVSLGLVMGMATKYWEGEKRHAIGKLGWLLVAWGIVLVGLTVLHHGDLNPIANPLAGLYIGSAIAGVVLIAYGEGPQSLIELPSIVSHILSYTRLVGILLASVALALVIDSIFLSDVSAGVAFAIVGVVILVFGQLFNLVLALFEPGIQGARLIYVEFFSKFYHGSGKKYLPFKGGRTHTVNEIELMSSQQETEARAQPEGQAEPIAVAVKPK